VIFTGKQARAEYAKLKRRADGLGRVPINEIHPRQSESARLVLEAVISADALIEQCS